MPEFNRSSRNKLNRFTAERFAGESLFARVARTVCRAECLPRKELYESWEVAKRVRRRFRGGTIVELAAGHGLLSALLLILDDTSPQAILVDKRRPASHARLLEVIESVWPRLRDRIEYRECPLDAVAIPLDALVVSVHACGALTDATIDAALDALARVAVLPCCHDLDHPADETENGELREALAGWLPGPLAMDVARAARLFDAGYRVTMLTIPEDITPMNRLLLGEPSSVELPSGSS